ncbi:flavin monooxygenase-like protein [Mortierella sp. GBAus27b]|nr:Cyclopentanone 1,2-monooxygenase (CPMO) [Mortierella sp. GBA43]KAI8348150.1 flavin monooxygenase-like protein [Mortierella sp. GBAus27b]
MATATASPPLVKKRVAVIGAGCTGLVAIKEVLDEPDHFDVVGFEQEPYVGGLWHYVDVTDENPNPHSSVYKSTIINTSKSMMTFSDYVIPGSWPTYLHNKKVVQYFDMYAEHFGLYKYIRFGTKVVEIKELKDDQNRWMVRFHAAPGSSPGSTLLGSGSLNNNVPSIQEEIFDYVIMCTGHHSAPRYPSFPGMKATDPEPFTGEQIHSHFYREVPERLKGKNIVVVGLGNSGVDLAVELSTNQCQVHLAVRSPIWVNPRWVLGKPLDHYTTRFAYWFPLIVLQLTAMLLIGMSIPRVHPIMRPKKRLFQAHTTINSQLHERISTGTIVPHVNVRRIGPGKQVEFEDGTVLDDIDAIYWCTGYHISVPIVDPTILTDGHQDLDKNRVWLWDYMLPPRHPNLAFVGLYQASGALMPVAELQSRFLVQAWAGKSPLKNPIPDMEQMDREIQRTQEKIQRQYDDAPRHTIQMDYTLHSDYLAKKIGCYPGYWKLVGAFGLIEGTRLKLESIFGPAIPLFFRLVGPHAWVGDEDKEGREGGARRNKGGEAARQAIWGYSGDERYLDSKYLRDDSLILLAKKRLVNGDSVTRQGVLIDV